jgi:hypothetical protein
LVTALAVQRRIGTGAVERHDDDRLQKDVENGLAASSQGQMRPPWLYKTKEDPV